MKHGKNSEAETLVPNGAGLPLLNISAIFPEICTRVYRIRRVLFTDAAWQPVEWGMADGMVYKRIHDEDFRPPVPQGALFHVLVSTKSRPVRKCSDHKLFRCLLRYAGTYHLHVFKIGEYDKFSNAVVISLPEEMGRRAKR